MSDGDLQTRIDETRIVLRDWKAWNDAISKAEQSGDLTEIVRLICLGVPVDQLTRRQLEEFGADYRVVCKRLGRKKLTWTVKGAYDIAACEVRKLRQDQRTWERWKGARIEARVKTVVDGARIEARARTVVDGAIVTVAAGEEFDQRLTEWVRLLLGTKDLVGLVAERRGLKPQTLAEHRRGSIGWGRRGKLPAKK